MTDEPTKRKRGRPKGYVCSPETRAKISAAKKGRKISPEQRAAVIAGHMRKLAEAQS